MKIVSKLAKLQLSWHWVDQDEERSLMAVSLSVRKFESLTK